MARGAVVTRTLYALLSTVAVSAAVLSFDALRGLALLCGFSRSLAWLLPVVVDAGAAAGSLVWLGGWTPGAARRFARVLALVLLGSSVAANALSHGLAAYGARPAWWVVVSVSGVAPAVLGAVVHLAVLVGRVEVSAPAKAQQDTLQEPAVVISPPAATCGDQPVPADEPEPVAVALHVAPDPTPPGDEPGDRVAELLAAGVGRRRLMKEAGLTEHEARKLLDERKNGTSG